MDSPSNRVLLLLFSMFQLLILFFVYFLIDKQNAFYMDMISMQNLQIQELSANLTRITLLQSEQTRLIIELQAQQKILAGVGITFVFVVSAFLLFFYSPGVSPEVVSNQVNAIADLFIKQSGTVAELSWKVGNLQDVSNATQSSLQDTSAATQFLLNAVQALEASVKTLS